MSTMKVLIPKEGTRAGLVIAKGSGVVGRDESEGSILADIEGNVYDAVNMRTYPQRVYHAAGRAKENYPTVARAFYLIEELVQVGEIDVDNWRLTLYQDEVSQAALREWAGPEAEEFTAVIDLRTWDRTHIS